MKKLIIAIVAMAAACEMASAANTWYVSKAGNNNNDGKSWTTAVKTIQAGIDKSANGDTVLVGEGVYSAHSETGAVRQYKYSDALTNYMPTVVSINKNITLASTNRAATIIEGMWDPNEHPMNNTSITSSGLGPQAVRCIDVVVTGYVIIKGFTIRKGSTQCAGANNKDSEVGGGICARVSGSYVWVYDCEFADCRAGTGAAMGGGEHSHCLTYNCHFIGNNAYKAGRVFYRTNYHRNCLFENNGTGDCLSTQVQPTTYANCTFVNNVYTIAYPNGNDSGTLQAFYNCAILTGYATSTAKTGSVYLNHCAQAVKDGLITLNTADVVDCTNNFNKTICYYSPLTGDWSLYEGSPLLNAGATYEHSTYDTQLPGSEWKNLDYNGNKREVGAAVDIGCFECQDEPKSGVMVQAIREPTKVDSFLIIANTNLWARFPARTQVRITPGWTTGEEMFAVLYGEDYTTAITNTFLHWPDKGDDQGMWCTLPSEGKSIRLSTYKSTGTLYADANYKGENGTPNGSESRPYANLNEAITNANNNSVIKVKPGVFNVGSLIADGTYCRVSLIKNVALRATGSAAETIVTGEKNLSIFRVAANGNWAQVQGMTLTGVNSTGSHCAFYSNSNAGWNNFEYGRWSRVSDCIISNNYAVSHAGIWGSCAERCYFADNRTSAANAGTDVGKASRGSTAADSILTSCVIEPSPYSHDATYQTTLINCTFDGEYCNISNKVLRAGNMTAPIINCAVRDAFIDAPSSTGIACVKGCVRTYEKSVSENSSSLSGKVYEYPKSCDYFGYEEEGDMRPIRGSAGLAVGEWSDKFHILEVGSFDGRAFTYAEEGSGKPLPGAYQTVVARVNVGDDGERTPTTPAKVVVTEADTLDVEFSETTHKYLGWVDASGVTNLTSQKAFTVNVSQTGIAEIGPVCSHELYVNASKADSNDGFSADTAKKTLTAILANAVAGDTVYAAAGDYNEGYSYYDGVIVKDYTKKLKTRAIVPAGVALIGHSKDDTYITGYHDKYGEDDCSHGRGTGWGTNAVRCVIGLAGSTVRGFIIRNGATRAQTGSEYDCNMGACVFASTYNPTTKRASTVTVIDCIIYGGVARSYIDVYGGIFVKCRITGGSSGSGSGGLIGGKARFEQCLLLNAGSSNSIIDHYGMLNCTLYSDKKGGSELAACSADLPIVNSVICFGGMKDNGTYTITRVRNNMVRAIGGTGNPTFSTGCQDNYFAGNFNEFELSTIANNTWCAKPTSIGSMVVTGNDDAQTDESVLADMIEADTDILGNPRVMNGKLDFGCYEYDWRSLYRDALKYHKIESVASATSGVIEDTTTKTIALTDGEKIVLNIKDKAGFFAKFAIAGEGKLHIYGDDEKELTPAAGLAEGTTDFEVTGQETVTLAYTGDGTATLEPFMSNVGLTIILR